MKAPDISDQDAGQNARNGDRAQCERRSFGSSPDGTTEKCACGQGSGEQSLQSDAFLTLLNQSPKERESSRPQHQSPDHAPPADWDLVRDGAPRDEISQIVEARLASELVDFVGINWLCP